VGFVVVVVFALLQFKTLYFVLTDASKTSQTKNKIKVNQTLHGKFFKLKQDQ